MIRIALSFPQEYRIIEVPDHRPAYRLFLDGEVEKHRHAMFSSFEQQELSTCAMDLPRIATFVRTNKRTVDNIPIYEPQDPIRAEVNDFGELKVCFVEPKGMKVP